MKTDVVSKLLPDGAAAHMLLGDHMWSDAFTFSVYRVPEPRTGQFFSHLKRSSCGELLPTVTYLFSHMALNEQRIGDPRNWFHMPLFLSSLN